MRKAAFALSLVFIFIIPWEGVVEIRSLGSAAKLVGLALAGFWLVTVIYTDQFRKPGPFHLLVFLFVLWNAASVFWSADPSQTLVHFTRWVQLLILVLILWDLYTTRAAVLAGLQAFVLGEFVAVTFAIQNFFTGDVYYNTYQRFSAAEQSSPDGFGVMVVFGIPVAWYLASTRSPFRMHHALKLVNYAYIPAAFFGLALSGTRTALIASTVAMAFGIASLTRLRLAARIVVFILLALVILLLLPHVTELKSFQRFGTTATELTEGDLNNRTNNWAEGFEVFTEHPVLGVGAAMYRSVNRLGKLAHNSYLSVLVELGLVGFALFGAILALAVLKALSLPKWDAAFWLTLLLAWAISASTLTYEYRKATWLILGLVVASAAVYRDRHRSTASVQAEETAGQIVGPTDWKQLSQSGYSTGD